MSSPKLFSIFLLLLALSACAQTPNTTDTKPAIEIHPTLEATPSSSESAIIGQVISINSKAVPDTTVRLANVYWNEDKSQGSFVIDESASPIKITDSNGSFVFNGLNPQDYVIVIGDLYGQHVILSNNDGSAQIFTAEAGQTLDVGMLEVDLESAPVIVATPSSGYPPANTPSPSAYP